MRIDAHHHLWKYDAEQYPWIDDEKSRLRQDFLTAELSEVARQSGIDGFVSVQARQTLEETDWLLGLANTEPLIQGVVGWVPLAESEAEQSLERLAENENLKGVRHVVQDEPDDFLLRDDFSRGVALLPKFDLVYDILIFPRQLANAIAFVDRHPNVRFVLDHLAKPRISASTFDSDWGEHLQELATRDNVLGCKISGLVTEVAEAEWTEELIRPYWEFALGTFGVDRLMYGSDWPVCLLRSECDRWCQTCELFTAELTPDEQQKFWSENAQKAYRL
ncbi:amidohydrolase family protein [Stratiformator vulcanicus]|uniref:Amidohydrolase n=1 Tax=Stratiformator vulcanicus TaxID=2527980 RepID=A0A517R5Y2_9PLAN|nr:amidohydrolase family protein [Stratiformator vulcanicus]QDT39272.1 Amidohydrolase [Stratiformator vulcanicus]